MERYAMVRDVDNVVDNISLWDGVTPYTPPAGITMVLINGVVCNIGYIYDFTTGTFSPPDA